MKKKGFKTIDTLEIDHIFKKMATLAFLGGIGGDLPPDDEEDDPSIPPPV